MSPLYNYYNSIRWSSRKEPPIKISAQQDINANDTISFRSLQLDQPRDLINYASKLNLSLDESNYLQSLSKAQYWCIEASEKLANECTDNNNCSKRHSGNNNNNNLCSNGMDLFRRGAPQRASSHEIHSVGGGNSRGSNNNNSNYNSHHHEHASNSMCWWDRYSISRERSRCTADGGPKVADTFKEGCEEQHERQTTPNAFQEQLQRQWRRCGLQTELTDNGIASSQLQRQQQQPQGGQTDPHTHKNNFKYTTCEAQQSSSSSAAKLFNAYQQQQQQHLQNNANLAQDNGFAVAKTDVDEQSRLVLVNKETLSELTDKIAFSMNKMKDLEEQVRVIPELKRRLENVIGDSNSGSLKDSNFKYSRFIGTNGTTSSSNNINNNDDTYSVNNQAADNNGADILRSLHPALQRHYNSFRHTNSRPANSMERRNHIFGRSAGNTTANSLDTRSPMLGSQDSGSMLLAFDNNSRSSRQSLTRCNQESISRAGGDKTVSSPKVEYEDLINDLISLSYSVNYASNTNSENGQSSDQQQPATLLPQQVKESTTPINDLQQQQQQHGLNLATKRNFSSIGNLTDSMPSAHHHINHNNNNDNRSSSILIGGNNNIANNENRSCLQNDGALNHQAHLSSVPGNIGWRRATKQSLQQLNYNYDKNIQFGKTSTPIKTKASLDSSSLLHINSNSNNSSSSSNQINNSNRYHSNILSAYHLTNYPNQSVANNSSSRNMILDPSQPSFTYQNNHQHNHNHQSSFNQNNSHNQAPNKATSSYLSRNYNGNGSLSLQTTPVKSQLDCGCQSFKEHLRYNSISREQRLNHVKSQSLSATTITTPNATNDANLPPRQASKMDASTNTELSMSDVVTRVELNNLIADMQKVYSTQSSSNLSRQFKSMFHKSSSLASDSSSDSVSGPKSSSANPSRSDSCEADENIVDDDHIASVEHKSDSSSSSNKNEDNTHHDRFSSETEPEGGDEDEVETNVGSFTADGPYSLGSSYQDPSDFEEYCAYGASIDRHTKDFMSQSTKIPNDLRFALIRLNDSIKRKRSLDQIESSSSCIEVIKKEWFEVAASKDSQPIKTKLYVEYFESFTKQLLNTVVNLIDSAGNTAMHYAASHFKLDIIEVLLGTKVCDVNSRNKAGYTPIMLLALAEIETSEEQEVARRLFSMGDVNIKARSDGQTALMLAASHDRVLTCKLLLECGADPSLQDYDGSTALMCGSERGNEDVVRCLLAHKLTDPTALDNDGLDALTIAMNNGHKNIGLLLYAAKNVPRLTRPSINPMHGNTSGYLCASLRRSKGKPITNYVRRADSLLNYATSKTG